MNKKDTENGLTLIELSIALIVIGLLVTAFLELYAIQQEKRLKELQEYKTFTIADGLARYLSENQHYPCPARRDLSVKHSNFGEPTGVGNMCNDTTIAVGGCDQGYCVTVNPADVTAKRIRIGSVPYKAIGVGKEDVIDVYGNQFTYAVVEEQASAGLYVLYDAALDNPPGTIEDKRKIILRDFVEDEGTRDPFTGIATGGANLTRPVEMVFFSHGKEGAGSYTASGTANAVPCPADVTEIDSKNCDNDAEFVTDLYSARSAAASGTSDDKLTSNLLKWVYIWDTAALDHKSIYNRDSGNMGVGIENGEEKLHIIGNLRVDAGGDPANMGKLKTRDLCDGNENDCFISEVLGGEAASPKRLQCPDNFFMKAIGNGQARCVSALGEGADTCNVLGQYANGVSIDATTGAISLSCKSVF